MNVRDHAARGLVASSFCGLPGQVSSHETVKSLYRLKVDLWLFRALIIIVPDVGTNVPATVMTESALTT